METKPDIAPRASWALQSPVKFGAAMALLMIVLKTPAIPLILLLGGHDTTGSVLKGGILSVLGSFALLLIETFLGQGLPIWIFKKCGVHRWVTQCIVSAMFFGLLHLPTGPGASVVGFIGGIVLSFCWLSWRSKSLATAFWSTTAVHATHNAICLPLFLMIHMIG